MVSGKQANLADELDASVHELRGSLTELMAGIRADVAKPLALSRQLGLDKNLAWKVSRIIRSTDAGFAVQNLPGPAGFEILLSAVQKAGASLDSLRRTKAAIESMGTMVERHVGDKSTLELVLDSMPDATSEKLIVSRKLAFRGASGIWGVQSRVRVNTAIVAPNRSDSKMLDVATIGAWVDFRRLRAESRWALFRHKSYGAAERSEPRRRAIDAAVTAGPPLLREFCSATLPPIQVIEDRNDETVYELGPSAVGNVGAFTCVMATFVEKIGPRFADADDDTGQFGALVSAPSEHLLFDLIVHRDCAFALRSTAQVFGVLAPGPANRHDRDLLPLRLEAINLGRCPPVLDTALLASYPAIIERVMETCRWDRDDFLAVRYQLDFPPFPSTVVVSFPLEKP
jgi:hypothetical protein